MECLKAVYHICFLNIFSVMFVKSDAAKIISNHEELGKLFNQAYMCGSHGHHASYVEIPAIPNCEWEDPRDKVVDKLVVTLFFNRTFSNLINAYSCQIEINRITTHVGFFGKKSVLNREKEYHDVDRQDCLREVHQLNEHKNKLIKLRLDAYSNDSSTITAQYHWCCKEHVIFNARFILKHFQNYFFNK